MNQHAVTPWEGSTCQLVFCLTVHAILFCPEHACHASAIMRAIVSDRRSSPVGLWLLLLAGLSPCQRLLMPVHCGVDCVDHGRLHGRLHCRRHSRLHGDVAPPRSLGLVLYLLGACGSICGWRRCLNCREQYKTTCA